MLPSRYKFTTLNPFTLKPTELFFHIMKISNQLASQNFLLAVSSGWFYQFTRLYFHSNSVRRTSELNLGIF